MKTEKTLPELIQHFKDLNEGGCYIGQADSRYDAIKYVVEELEKTVEGFVTQIKTRIIILKAEIPKCIEKCHICGAKLKRHGYGDGKETYYCSAVKYIRGSKKEQEHFSLSRVEHWVVPEWRIKDRIKELEHFLVMLGAKETKQ